MENHLKKVYSQARRDVGREWYKYMESIKPKADELLKAYEDAKLTGDKDLIKKTGKEYGQFLREKTYMNERYKSMLDTTTTKLANVNEIALSYLNDEMPSVYATNYNQVSKDMPAGISFDIVDENTVKNLVKDNPKLLPTKKLDIPKDKRWNQKAINAQVLQGIIQGESIPEMAKRLTPIMDRNKTSAIRNARTMTTSAQNKGRLDSYKAAQDNGVVLHKVWMATNSERTRAWHAALNGVEVDIDEPFENDYGEIMFPGDPDADPGNVYNCRCTLTTKIIGFKREDGSIKYIDGEESDVAWRLTDSSYRSVETVAEAEQYAKDAFVEGGGFNLTGKTVSFKGVDVDTANRINQRLTSIYEQFDISKLSSLECFGKANKKVFSKHSDAPFITTNFGNIGINSTIVKNAKELEKYNERGRKSFQYVMDNMDKLTGEQKQIALAYQKAGKSLVGDSLEDMITHEVGHHISYMPRINSQLREIQTSTDWKKTAERLSGYANHSFGEYVAESFNAYCRGEHESLQPEMIKVFDSLRK